ncbi:hypothetical protein N008_07155 [Hymenobacter sp. APR13]|nr:hypothetical protein N008_07155 [Hymenobacter sp. APR13]
MLIPDIRMTTKLGILTVSYQIIAYHKHRIGYGRFFSRRGRHF